MDAATDLPLERTDAVCAAAGSLGATDLFVFRRITADRFVHVGGLGRGEGWAGTSTSSSPPRTSPASP